MGGIWLDSVVPTSVDCPREEKVLSHHRKIRRPREAGPGRWLEQYRLKVGDLCFAALGQIVNRSYEAAGHRPTNCIIINSPIEKPEISAFLREVWSGDIEETLRRSLECDIACSNPDLRIGAAARLWTYFPEFGEPLIVERVEAEDWAVLKAAKLLESERISKAVDRTIGTTVRPYVFAMASSETFIHRSPDSWLARAREVVEGADPSDADDRGGVTHIAGMALATLGPKSRPWFEWVVRQEEGAWKVKACVGTYYRKEAAGEWLAEVFSPLLTDPSSYDDGRVGPWGVREAAAFAVIQALDADCPATPPKGQREEWLEMVGEILKDRLQQSRGPQTDRK